MYDVALSAYNQWAEKVLAADLTAAGLRLALTLQRLLLGYNHLEDKLGRAQLRQVSRLHGRSFDRAVLELEDAGLVKVDRGGRGKRTRYRLLLATSRSSAASSGSQLAAQLAAEMSLNWPLESGHSGLKDYQGVDFNQVKDELLAHGLLKDR